MLNPVCCQDSTLRIINLAFVQSAIYAGNVASLPFYYHAPSFSHQNYYADDLWKKIFV